MKDLFLQTILGVLLIVIPVPVSAISNVKMVEMIETECVLLHHYLKKDFNNDPIEVLKLQAFLINFERHHDVSLTGVFDQTTLEAVSAFQMKYFKDILEPWGRIGGTGYVYITTQKKINEIYCQHPLPLSDAQKQEIDARKTFREIEDVKVIESPEEVGISTSTIAITPIIGAITPDKGQNIYTKYFYGLILVLIVLYILIKFLDNVLIENSSETIRKKFLSVRAYIKSWYLVVSARVKSILMKKKEVLPSTLKTVSGNKTTLALMIIEPKK